MSKTNIEYLIDLIKKGITTSCNKIKEVFDNIYDHSCDFIDGIIDNDIPISVHEFFWTSNDNFKKTNGRITTDCIAAELLDDILVLYLIYHNGYSNTLQFIDAYQLTPEIASAIRLDNVKINYNTTLDKDQLILYKDSMDPLECMNRFYVYGNHKEDLRILELSIPYDWMQ